MMKYVFDDLQIVCMSSKFNLEDDIACIDVIEMFPILFTPIYLSIYLSIWLTDWLTDTRIEIYQPVLYSLHNTI